MVLLKNFTTYSNKEEKLLDKWAFMDTADDLKSVNIIDSNGESLGTIHRHNENDVVGDNYFLSMDEKQVMAHKEEKGWKLYDVTNNGFHLAPIDDNSQRAKNLKILFHEAKKGLNGLGRHIRPQVFTPTRSRL